MRKTTHDMVIPKNSWVTPHKHPTTSCLGEITRCKRNILLSTDWNCALQCHPNLVPKLYVCNSSLYCKSNGEEKRLLCCACLMLEEKAHKEKANLLLQYLRSIVYRNLHQRCAYGALNWRVCKYLQSAENQHRGLVAEPKPYPARQNLCYFFS